MADRIFGAKPLSEPMMFFESWAAGNEFQWNLNLNFIILIQENTFENVVCQNGSHFVQGENKFYTVPLTFDVKLGRLMPAMHI